MTGVRVLIPIYDDWASVERVLLDLDAALAAAGERCWVTLIDDGSLQPRPWGAALRARLSAVERLEIVTLHANRGQNAALAIGLAHVAAGPPCEALVVMDGDGEDRPQDVVVLLAAFRRDPGRVAVAQRRRRNEGLAFKSFYALFKRLFRLTTGRRISFGNFSVCPWPVLQRLVHMSELYNHFPATLVRARQPLQLVPTDRGQRHEGHSKFGLVAHLQHGFGAIAVDLDRVLVRLLILLGLVVGALILVMVWVMVAKLSGESVPGWASTALGLTSVLIAQSVVFAFLLLFISLRTRGLAQLVPARDHRAQIARVEWLEAPDPTP